MTNQASKADLHSAMKGKSTTDEWDVLVSYSQDRLNKYLKKAWEKTSEVANIQFDKNNWVGDENYPEHFEILLANPMLEFIRDSTGAWAKLTMDISGSSAPKDRPGHKLVIDPGNYIITVTVPTTAIRGDGGAKQGGTEPIHFDDKKVSSFYITFLFNNDHVTWNIFDKKTAFEMTSLGDDRHKQALQSARQKIQDHFHDLPNSTLLSLSIAEVSNNKHTNASDLLIPKSFSFASQDGVLNVFINTKGGRPKPGLNRRIFNLRDEKVYTPIPKGYGASIIISRDTLINKFLIPEMLKSASAAHLTGNDGIKELGGIGEGNDKTGAKFEIRYSQSLSTSARHENNIFITLYFEGLSIDFKDQPLQLEISDDSNLKTKYHWKWTCKGTVKYYEIISNSKRGNMVHFERDYDVSIKDNSTEMTTLHDDKISWNIKFTRENQPDGKKGDQNITVNLNLYEYDMKLPDLDYFRVTNIFAPGKHMIDAKDSMFPYDFVILGDLASP